MKGQVVVNTVLFTATNCIITMLRVGCHGHSLLYETSVYQWSSQSQSFFFSSMFINLDSKKHEWQPISSLKRSCHVVLKRFKFIIIAGENIESCL